MKQLQFLFLFSALSLGNLQAGSIPAGDASIVGWATGYQDLIRGPKDISNLAKGVASYGNPNDMLGPSDADGSNQPVVSLGDGGSVVLTFANPITNGIGDDFAVFENGNSNFLELAFVEVSSDGTNFFRFASLSETQTDTQIGTFGSLSPNDLTNLAGKDTAGIGTGFDLEELSGTSGLNIHAITQVKIIDVVGSIDPAYGTRDSLNRLINDPWPTDFAEGADGYAGGSGGFDLDAVGVIHTIPEPSLFLLSVLGLGVILRHVSRRKS